MKYPKIPDYGALIRDIELYAQHKAERGAKGIRPVLVAAEKALKSARSELKRLPVDGELARREPNDLAAIRKLRPKGPRRLWDKFDRAEYLRRVEGALLGRMAGCTLGAPVEGNAVEKMQALADENGDDFPPTDYWSRVPNPKGLRYGMSRREEYTRREMDGVPVDDDIAYTLLGLLVVEDFGPDFSIKQNGEAWLKYLPYACTAEKVALDNLRAGVPAGRAAEKKNPFCEWIGADIRSDPWGYMAPGLPEVAADMAYRDAYLSHRRNGIYGEMFFAAAIAAAFAVDDPVEAVRIGLTEIPARCSLAGAVRWALKRAPEIKDYRDARAAVDRRFAGMHKVHTINNACLTIWGLTIGRTDFSRVIGETVAMGLDNDCTAATAGSICGATVGKRGIPKHWYTRFHDVVHSYLARRPRFTVSGLVKRFARQAARVHRAAG
jgi:ADP-ribosylglycohydrolase